MALPPDLPKFASDLHRIAVHPDYWFPLAWSSEIKRRKTLALGFADKPVVLFRSESGRIVTREGRCARRQVPLSLGVVQGETLKCGYHGWDYNCAGQFIDVPYLGRDLLPNGVRSYPARQMDELGFIFPGDRALAQRRLPASLGSKADRRYKTRRLNRKAACHDTIMPEHYFDMNHQFLPRSVMGSIKATCLSRRPESRRTRDCQCHGYSREK